MKSDFVQIFCAAYNIFFPLSTWRTFWCAPKCSQCHGPKLDFFLRLLLLLSSSFWLLLLLLLSFLLLLPSRVQNWDALVSKGEKKEKRYQLAKQSAKIRTTTNNSNSNNNTHIYIYPSIYLYLEDLYALQL